MLSYEGKYFMTSQAYISRPRQHEGNIRLASHEVFFPNMTNRRIVLYLYHIIVTFWFKIFIFYCLNHAFYLRHESSWYALHVIHHSDVLHAILHSEILRKILGCTSLVGYNMMYILGGI